MIRLRLSGIVRVACCLTALLSLAPLAKAVILVEDAYEIGFAFSNSFGIWPGRPAEIFDGGGVGNVKTTTDFGVPTGLNVPFPAIEPISGAESIHVAFYYGAFGIGEDGFEINEFSVNGVESESTPEERSVLPYDAAGKVILRFSYKAELVAPDPDAVFDEGLLFDVPGSAEPVLAGFKLSFFDSFYDVEAEAPGLRTAPIAGYGDVFEDEEVGGYNFDLILIPLMTDGLVHTLELPLTLLTPAQRAEQDFNFDDNNPAYDDMRNVVESISITMFGGNPRVVTFDSFELLPFVSTVFPGDFNGDGKVDAADYTVWRNNLGTNFDLNGNGNEDGDSAGVVDHADYAIWKQFYGAFEGSGSFLSTTTPEPSALLMLVLGCGISSGCLGRRRH